jgi:hypothetical protein
MEDHLEYPPTTPMLNMPEALCFSQIEALRSFALSQRTIAGMVLEFGVWKARSTNFFARHLSPEIIYGVDSFEGLKEDWRGWGFAKGDLSLGGQLPKVLPNVNLKRTVRSVTSSVS